MVDKFKNSQIFTNSILIMVLLLSFDLSLANSHSQEITIRAPQGKHDQAHKYFKGLLRLSLEESKKYKVVTSTQNMTQKRALSMVAENKVIDLNWAGTNLTREENLRPIRIPLTLGALGVRLLVIKKANLNIFKNIKTIEELKKFKACQGLHWPDSDILESNGFKVARVAKFENMYKMLKSERCDYFPRSIGEGYAEVKSFSKNGELIAFDKILISYKFPMYFFVSKQNELLASTIERGLVKAIEDGRFLNFMKTSSVTEPIFPISKYKKSKIFKIENPFLPPKTPKNTKSLWILSN